MCAMTVRDVFVILHKPRHGQKRKLEIGIEKY